jgi:hypothetical protein
MKFNFILEKLLPILQQGYFVIKDEIISLFPNTPGTNHEQVHEEGSNKIFTLLH